MKLLKLIILLTFLLQAACGSAIQTEEAEEPGNIELTETALALDDSNGEGEPDRGKTPTWVPDEAFIIFKRSGGFAGVDKTWVIHLEGQIEERDGEKRQVEPAETQALFDLIQTAGFFDFEDTYIPEDTCCDRYNYSIMVHYEDRSKTVETIDDSPTQPEGLVKIITAINELVFEP